MPARLIVNADDFGQTPGINQAIEELHRAGALSSATLMACGMAFDSAVEIAERNPALGVGCHVVLVDGTPTAALEMVPTLLDRSGKVFRQSIGEFASAAVSRMVRGEEIEREAVAQIRRLQTAGLNVTHIDTHKHVHLFPAVLAPLLRAAARCGVGALRRPFEPQWSAAHANAPLKRRMQLWALKFFSAQFDRLSASLSAQGLVPSATLGITATGTLDSATLRSMLTALPSDGVFELCCHPGHADAALQAHKTRLRASREVEYRALLEVIPQIIRNRDAPLLIHYGNLPSRSG